MKELTGSDSDIVHIPYEQAYEEGFEDMMRRVPDISRLSELTGYRPSLGVREILERVIADQRARLEAAVA